MLKETHKNYKTVMLRSTNCSSRRTKLRCLLYIMFRFFLSVQTFFVGLEPSCLPCSVSVTSFVHVLSRIDIIVKAKAPKISYPLAYGAIAKYCLNKTIKKIKLNGLVKEVD